MPSNGAGDRTRTGTRLPARDFKSLVSTIPPHRRGALNVSRQGESVKENKAARTAPRAGESFGAAPKRRRAREIEGDTGAQSTVTRPLSETVICMPSFTYARKSSPRLSTTGILASVHTSARMAPEAARESMGLEKSMQAGCLL